MSDRQGIEIDYCPKCRGVWLDRGELDKIIERNAQFQVGPAQVAPAPQLPSTPGAGGPWLAPGQEGQGYAQQSGRGGHGSGHGGGHGGSRRGRESFLGRLFD